ncbi:MAG: AMP-binding protein [Firmicutes bacterium]|nr:AMP-binding protein [Bacillota bacterium]
MKARLEAIAERIHALRDIAGYNADQMALLTDTTPEQYLQYESGTVDLPFSFIHKCATAFDVEINALLEGHTAKLSSYTVTRKGQGQKTAEEPGIEICNLAPLFRNKLVEPYYVTYDYDEAQLHRPINLVTHSGQEFDIVLSGQLKIQIGEHTEILNEGDSILYNSSTPHGMIAVGGEKCVFCAVVVAGEEDDEQAVRESLLQSRSSRPAFVCDKFFNAVEDENGVLQSLTFPNADKFNFAFDCVDAIAEKYPDKLAMLHLDKNKVERRLTFENMRKESNRTANYFKSLGIKRGDRVMLILKRHYQFWYAMLALHKLGAIAIPATNLLKEHDLTYRFDAAEVSAIVCSADGEIAEQVDLAQAKCPSLKTKILVGGDREGWHNYDEEYLMFRSKFERAADAPCGDDLMLMLFTSGTTGYPRIAAHNYKYALGHYITARYWHCVHNDGLHFTISETGWGKALWGKFYGQWLCEGAVFTYDFDKFNGADILPMFAKYNITTFCAPPTMYRMFIKEDLSKYDLSSIKHATTAGEALNPEVFRQFEAQTGLQIYEGFGQTETTLTIGNLIGNKQKIGSMGKPIPTYDLVLLDSDGNEVAPGENGEICIRAPHDGNVPCGLFAGYYRDPEQTADVWHDGYYHTRDVAWQDEDGYLWYVGRADDVIKSSGYRIGPFEIESVIMELPYVLECAVSAAPDEVRGQIVKASIVLVKGTEGSEELKKEIQNYVKKRTAPYKYPRIVVFRDEMPKTISGKIIRKLL